MLKGGHLDEIIQGIDASSLYCIAFAHKPTLVMMYSPKGENGYYPFDDLLMVQCLKQKGHAAAATSDDTNDAPTLKETDKRLSLRIQGTEVAKVNLDILTLDDNFASMVTILR